MNSPDSPTSQNNAAWLRVTIRSDLVGDLKLKCPECKVGTVIEAPTSTNYETGNESVCNLCGLILEEISDLAASGQSLIINQGTRTLILRDH